MKNTVKTTKGTAILDKLDRAQGFLGNFANLKETVDSLATEIERGNMNYTLFQLTEGILLLYFFPEVIPGKLITVGFVSAEPGGLGQMLFHGEKFINQIKPLLKGELS